MYSNSFTVITMFLTAVLKSFWLVFSAPLAKQQEWAQQLAVCQAEADRLFFKLQKNFEPVN